jgi:hypothetical protein
VDRVGGGVRVRRHSGASAFRGRSAMDASSRGV